MTEQTPPPQGYVRDMSAAQATFGTVAGLFAIELTSIPVASSSGGFVYRFSPTLGTAERSSDSFGPLFTERALRNGRRQFSIGLTYQFADFSTLQGADLGGGTFPTNNIGVSPARRFDAESASLASIVRSYERAYDRLDAAAAAALWPSVDERALARAFARLQTQDLEFDNCTFAVSDNEATAQCAGRLQYSRRIGDPSLKSERHVWTIEFVRTGESWHIVRITAR